MVDDKLTATNTATPSCAPQTEEEYTMRGGSAMHVGSHALDRTQVQKTFIVSGGHDTERKITMWMPCVTHWRQQVCDTVTDHGLECSRASMSYPHGIPHPMPHTSSPTHSNVTVSPFRGPAEHSGSLSNVGHRADEPSVSVSSSHSP